MSGMTLDAALDRSRADAAQSGEQETRQRKLVVFALGEELFAFPGESISEILARADVSFVPGCPAWLEGVINVRGDIESVIRPHAMLRRAEDGIGEGASILLGHGAGMRSGIRVDKVLDVVDVPQDSILPPPATLPEHLRLLVLGVTRLEERPVAVLDLDKLFATYAGELG